MVLAILYVMEVRIYPWTQLKKRRNYYMMVLTGKQNSGILNYWINHPEIFPFLSNDNQNHIDASDLLDMEGTHLFSFEKGALLFIKIDDKIYEGDIYFLRKSGAKNAAIQALKHMFEVVGAQSILCRIPQFNKKAQIFVSNLGFSRFGKAEYKRLKNGKYFEVTLYKLDKNKWVL
jgi:hypothetical protein